MAQRPKRGRVYRRCGCTDGSSGKQLGSWCPAAGRRYRAWSVDVCGGPGPGGGQAPDSAAGRVRQPGGDGPGDGAGAGCRVPGCVRGPDGLFLYEWPESKRPTRAPNTWAGYRACIERDLVPAFGGTLLLDLRPKQIDAWVDRQLAASRGRTTVHHAVAMLRNALNHAVRTWRLRYNSAEHSVPPKPRRRGAHLLDPGPGRRVSPRSLDTDRREHREGPPGEPKTEASRAWVSLAPSAMAALHRQADLQMAAHPNGRLKGLDLRPPGWLAASLAVAAGPAPQAHR
ncbi:hypothetical protein ACFC6U_17485 [Kitasatospora purpeofusca]|uniref:hypothetical protein n=1 Tax=Kitasatospora purpeofusca TaxID=67352 RepID=UPI0035D9B2E7